VGKELAHCLCADTYTRTHTYIYTRTHTHTNYMHTHTHAHTHYTRTHTTQGDEKSVELYTQAVSACKLRGYVNLDTALKIYAHMQHNNIQPDKKFFAALIATAGTAGGCGCV